MGGAWEMGGVMGGGNQDRGRVLFVSALLDSVVVVVAEMYPTPH
jgi:hypothetical protein